MSDPSRVVVSGPLSTFAPGFLEELLRHGYRPGSVAKQLQLMAHLGRWMEAQDLEPSALDRVEVERFVQERRASGRTRLVSPRALDRAASGSGPAGGASGEERVLSDAQPDTPLRC